MLSITTEITALADEARKITGWAGDHFTRVAALAETLQASKIAGALETAILGPEAEQAIADLIGLLGTPRPPAADPAQDPAAA